MSLSPVSSVLVWAIGLVGAAVLAKTMMKERSRVNAELERERVKRAAQEPRRTLRRDPKTGVYRP